MKVTYFDDTDTLLVEFSEAAVEDTRDLDENTLGEYDNNGKLVAITLEHASENTDLQSFSFSNTAILQHTA
jgi:uncharacterized protein YuzE